MQRNYGALSSRNEDKLPVKIVILFYSLKNVNTLILCDIKKSSEKDIESKLINLFYKMYLSTRKIVVIDYKIWIFTTEVVVLLFDFINLIKK